MSATTLIIKTKAKQRDKMIDNELTSEADRIQSEINTIVNDLNDPKSKSYNPKKYKKLQKKYGGTEEYQKAKELKAKGGMIKKYSIGGDVRSNKKNKPKKSNNIFIARGCGKVMNNRRKKTKCY